MGIGQVSKSSPQKSVLTVYFGTISLFMSFCHILSTLWSKAAFHNFPHFSSGRQMSGIKSTVLNCRSGTKSKTPVHFIPLFWNPRKVLCFNTFISTFFNISSLQITSSWHEKWDNDYDFKRKANKSEFISSIKCNIGIKCEKKSYSSRASCENST